MFLSYLEFNKIQYVIVTKPFTFELFNWDKLFKHRCLKQDIGSDMKDSYMTIWDETNPYIVKMGKKMSLKVLMIDMGDILGQYNQLKEYLMISIINFLKINYLKIGKG